jgi:hypothetical protein
VKFWRGEHVVVFPQRRWFFHTCNLCGKSLDLKSEAAKTGVGQECAKRTSATDVDRLREDILERDRANYRREVRDLGFRIERYVRNVPSTTPLIRNHEALRHPLMSPCTGSPLPSARDHGR